MINKNYMTWKYYYSVIVRTCFQKDNYDSLIRFHSFFAIILGSIGLGVGQDDNLFIIFLVIGAILLLTTFIYFYFHKVYKNEDNLLPCDEDANKNSTKPMGFPEPKKPESKVFIRFIKNILVIDDIKNNPIIRNYLQIEGIIESSDHFHSENDHIIIVNIKIIKIFSQKKDIKDIIESSEHFHPENDHSDSDESDSDESDYDHSEYDESDSDDYFMDKIRYPFSKMDLNIRSINGLATVVNPLQKHFWTWILGRVYFVDKDIIKGQINWVWVQILFYYPMPTSAPKLILPCSLSENLSTHSIWEGDYVLLEYDANIPGKDFHHRIFTIIEIEDS